MQSAEDKRLLVGRIVGLFGIEGWVKIESYTQPRERIFKYKPWLLRHPLGEAEVAAAKGRVQGKGLVGCLPDVQDRDAAAALVGAEIWVARSQLPKPKRGEHYWIDLEGLSVVTVGGIELGKVSHLFATGANDVLVVREGERERLIPYVMKQFVREVDLPAGRITVDWDPEF